MSDKTRIRQLFSKNGEETDQKGSPKMQIVTALLATIPTFTYGIQIGWLSPMGPLLKSEASPAHAPLTDFDISCMATALPWAGICGIPFASYASDRFGRKKSIIGVSVLSCISWIIKLTCLDATSLIIARLFAGFAAGGCFVVVPVYVKEISDDSWRGALASLTMTVCKLGVIFVYAVGMACSYYVNQWVYLSVAMIHVIVFFFMPESPNFLLKIGREQGARKALSFLRSVKQDHCIVTNEINKLKSDRRKFEEMPRLNLLSVVRDKPAFSALRMTLTLMAMQTLSGCFALMNYAADVFTRAGTSWSPNTLALLMGSLQLAGSFFTTVSIEKFGRKPALAASSLIVSICMTTLGTCLYLNGDKGRGTGMGTGTGAAMGTETGAGAWAVAGAAAVCICFLAYGAGLAPVPMVLMSEVFTFELRARMAGASMAFSFFCSSMTVLLYTPVSNQLGAYVVFYAFAVVTLFGVIYTILCVPETKGKNLEEIQKYWKKEPEPVFV